MTAKEKELTRKETILAMTENWRYLNSMENDVAVFRMYWTGDRVAIILKWKEEGEGFTVYYESKKNKLSEILEEAKEKSGCEDIIG